MAMNATENGPRRITILGSTGSIGCNTIDLVEREPERYFVEALTANRNVALLAEQARRLRPRIAVVADPQHYRALREALSGTNIEVAAGDAAVVEAASRPVDWMMAGIVGAAGLAPTLAGVRQGTIVALANKETLVCAGELVLREVKARQATLLPVDSEHNAVFQVFDFAQSERIARIILTASGGPFRTRTREEMRRMTPEQAVAHPNWRMGAKISVDSATLMNKGLEVIEAYYLFPVRKDQIDVIVHPQSVIHSMVEYIDGSVLAQLGSPDMRTPIAYAMGWPRRIAAPSPRLDLAAIGSLTFEKPDLERFPALGLARAALEAGGSAPTVLNAANEVAVHAFLDRRIGFLDIAKIVGETLDRMLVCAIDTLEMVAEIDRSARALARESIERNRVIN
ncbi:MAG: 1-deoxy-D-xylulose-5-phosphate reductoisomerase [Rhodospirillaceae bacterium]|nr:1-deoxy-D-xylulose-5-phosphate reductoisomerase [Rhodospirillaceae bacterium]